VKLKEVKFRPRTDQHDIQHKSKKVNQFLAAGDRVRLTVRFRGRELAHKDLGSRLLERVIALAPENTYVSPFRDEPKSVSVDLVLKSH
jgi:translation initiation factor IF-3